MRKNKEIVSCPRLELNVLPEVLFLTFAVLFYVNPLSGVGLNDWTGSFCTAILNSISISKRIRHFYVLFLVLFPVTALLLWGILSKLLWNKKEIREFCHGYCMLFGLALFSFYVGRYALPDGSAVNRFEGLLYGILFLGIVLVLAVFDRKEQLTKKDCTFLFALGYSVSIVLVYLFHSSARLRFLSQGAAFLGNGLALAVGGFYLKRIQGDFSSAKAADRSECAADSGIGILLWLPLVVCIAIELLNIGNYRGIWKRYSYRTYMMALLVFFMCLTAAVLWAAKKNKMPGWVRRCLSSYVPLLLGVGALIYAPGFQTTAELADYYNLYELGNTSCIQETIVNGKLPIIDYFSAHALSDVWDNFLFYVLNGDPLSAVASPYSGLKMVISMVLLYTVLRECFQNREYAALFVLLVPYDLSSVKWASVCFLAIVCTIRVMRKHTWGAYILFWISLAFGVAFRYDEGVAIGIGCILASLLTLLLQGKLKSCAKKYVLSGAGVTIVCLILGWIYCAARGIRLADRILQWIAAAVSSNETWATESFGNPLSLEFFLAYFAVPFGVVSILLFLLVFHKKYREQNPVLYLLVLIFGFAQLLNIPRTIVYHNLAVCSGSTGVLLSYTHWTAALFACLLLMHHKPGRELAGFAAVFFGTVFLEGALITGSMVSGDTAYVQRGFARAEERTVEEDSRTANQNRIVLSEELQAFADGFRVIFDSLLEEDETFVDFSNLTSLYALTGREMPFYVAQSPGLLTTERSMEHWIAEVESHDCPLAVMGTENKGFTTRMTSIPHNIRYQMAAEYLYRNYRPLLQYRDLAVWCRTERYETYTRLLDGDLSVYEAYGIKLIDWGYDGHAGDLEQSGDMHVYELADVPYLRAKFGREPEGPAVSGVTLVGDSLYEIEQADRLEKETGNDLKLICSCPDSDPEGNLDDPVRAGRAIVRLGVYENGLFTEKYSCSMNLMEGTQSYVIPVSSDYYWYCDGINAVQVESDREITDIQMQILKGKKQP